ncbi:MAG TPA: hypothetical protein VGJ15_07370 [Pirellulales bacterium]|jgi:hypothetical protein
MTTITIPPEIEAPLAEAAKRQGTTAELLALESLRERFVCQGSDQEAPREAKNLAEFLQGYVGVIHGERNHPSGTPWSEDTGKKFTELLVEQRRQKQQ